jgi:hypothetical protein
MRGDGRGLRPCQSEAQAAFGDGSVFVERLIPRPRHIECRSSPTRHGNDPSPRARLLGAAPPPEGSEWRGAGSTKRCEQILADAIKLASGAEYVAGTVEFLVSPETGEHFFIECNPRIQVEHTITEQVMGFDLVEAQFRIAAGASLAALGLADQKSAGTPHGFAVQARVVVQGTGTISAYKEPRGPASGRRLRLSGRAAAALRPRYQGHRLVQLRLVLLPPPSIGRSVRSMSSHRWTAHESAGAAPLCPDVRAGDARTTLLRSTEILRAAASPPAQTPVR